MNDQLFVDLELTIQAVTKELVREFNRRELSYLNLNIKASGSTTGDVKIEYIVGAFDYGDDHAKGNRLGPTAEEYFRRRDWEKRNKALLLTFDGSGELKATSDDDPPY